MSKKDSLSKILEQKKAELAGSMDTSSTDDLVKKTAIIARIDKLLDAENANEMNKKKLSNEKKRYDLDVERLALERLKLEVEQEKIEIQKGLDNTKINLDELKLKFEKDKFVKDLDERTKERKWNFIIKLVEIGAKVGIAVFCTYRLGMKILKAEYADNIIAPKGAVNAQSLLAKF